MRIRTLVVVAATMLVSIALVLPAEAAAGAEHWIARFPGPGYSVDQVAGIAVAPDGSPPYGPRPETRRLLVACATTLALLTLGAPAASARPFRQDTTKCRQGVAQERIRADGYGKVAEPLLTIESLFQSGLVGIGGGRGPGSLPRGPTYRRTRRTCLSCRSATRADPRSRDRRRRRR